MIKMLKERNTFSIDYLDPLFTLCTLEDAAERLRTEFMSDLTIECKAGTKLNPAITEWNKITNMLKAYYVEFGLTPRTVKAANGTPTGTQIPSVDTRRGFLEGPQPSGQFDPI